MTHSPQIPTELGNIPMVYNLYLQYNEISGTIPTQFGKFTNMAYGLYLSSTQVSARVGSCPNHLNE